MSKDVLVLGLSHMQTARVAIPEFIFSVGFLNVSSFQEGTLKVNKKFIRADFQSRFDGDSVSKELIFCPKLKSQYPIYKGKYLHQRLP
jgi:hypothetical protein